MYLFYFVSPHASGWNNLSCWCNWKIFFCLTNSKYLIFYYMSKVGGSSWDEPGHRKTPEMSELESDSNSLKSWAHNFEKLKNRAKSGFLKINIFSDIVYDPTSDWIIPNYSQMVVGTPAPGMSPSAKDTGNERIRKRQTNPEILSTQPFQKKILKNILK